LTGEFKMIEGGLSDFLLQNCGAVGSMKFNVDYILMTLRRAKKFLMEISTGESASPSSCCSPDGE